MKFGTFHLMEQPFSKSEPEVYREQLAQMRLADEMGFDWVWLTEHHFSSVPYVPNVPGEYSVSASPYALACAVSQITNEWPTASMQRGPSPPAGACFQRNGTHTGPCVLATQIANWL